MSGVAGRGPKTTVPVAVVMISLNEGHNLRAVCENLQGWAQQIFLVDSYSKDDTVDIALQYGVHIVQRRFRDFGDQWNFALQNLPISSPWTMKLDPDERITDKLKQQIAETIARSECDAISVIRRLWFMQRPLPVRQKLIRLWRTGNCRFTDVAVNEHPIVGGTVCQIKGELEHHDSPDLDHWYEKQNRYTTAEAIAFYKVLNLADEPRLFGTAFQRRIWLKKNFRKIPGRYQLFFGYQLFVVGAWRAGWVGIVWSRLRAEVMRMIELKLQEMQRLGEVPRSERFGPGTPDPRVLQAD